MNAFVHIECVEVLDAAPTQRGRLVVPLHGRVGRGEHQEAKVQVPVRVFAGRRDDVDVDVDGRHRHVQADDAGLLNGFAQGDRRKVGVSVGVATRLQPLAPMAPAQSVRAATLAKVNSRLIEYSV